jgi:hypothetical protein
MRTLTLAALLLSTAACTYVERTPAAQPAPVVLQQPGPTVYTPAPTVMVRPAY